jgi:hypothetical protein
VSTFRCGQHGAKNGQGDGTAQRGLCHPWVGLSEPSNVIKTPVSSRDPFRVFLHSPLLAFARTRANQLAIPHPQCAKSTPCCSRSYRAPFAERYWRRGGPKAR